MKPKIIVCQGKKVFDMLCDRKMNFKDAHGGWFWSPQFNYCRGELDTEFRLSVVKDAKARLVAKCIELLGPEVGITIGIQTVNMIKNGDVEKAWEDLKKGIPLDKFVETKPFLDHLVAAPTFNIREPIQTELTKRPRF